MVGFMVGLQHAGDVEGRLTKARAPGKESISVDGGMRLQRQKLGWKSF